MNESIDGMHINDDDISRLKQVQYWTLYTNAAYGLGLYTMSRPCSICCAPPCALPNGVDDEILSRKEKKCCGDALQIDNSNLKVFIQRTGIEATDLLLVSQFGDVHTVNFYVCVDREKRSLVIALRGTMSIQDSITDIECMPMHFPEIDEECYVHSGMGKSARYVFEAVIGDARILQFLRENPKYNVTICGHSLGAGVCVILSLMMRYGTNENLSLFINEDR